MSSNKENNTTTGLEYLLRGIIVIGAILIFSGKIDLAEIMQSSQPEHGVDFTVGSVYEKLGKYEVEVKIKNLGAEDKFIEKIEVSSKGGEEDILINKNLKPENETSIKVEIFKDKSEQEKLIWEAKQNPYPTRVAIPTNERRNIKFRLFEKGGDVLRWKVEKRTYNYNQK